MKLYSWSRWQCAKYRLERKGTFKFVTPVGHQKSVERREKIKKAWKWCRRNITLTHISAVISILVFTGALMLQGYAERGEFCIGGECLIPPIALILWLAIREAEK